MSQNVLTESEIEGVVSKSWRWFRKGKFLARPEPTLPNLARSDCWPLFGPDAACPSSEGKIT